MLLGIQLYVLHRHGFNDPAAFHEPDREIFEQRGSRHIGSGWAAPGRGSIRNVQVRAAGFHVLEFAQGIHFLTIIGTACSLFLTTLTAYPLSKYRLRGRKGLLLIFVFTMLFSGGLIPTYLLMQNLNLVNSFPVLFLPAMVNVYNMLIIKTISRGFRMSWRSPPSWMARGISVSWSRSLYRSRFPLWQRSDCSLRSLSGMTILRR